MRRRSPRGREGLAQFLPQVGIGLGLALNTAGLLSGSTNLIATGANVLTVSGWLLLRQRRRSGDEDE